MNRKYRLNSRVLEHEEAAIDHLVASYENAQRTIRLLDAKVSGILVFITSLVGVSGLLVKWMIELVSSEIDQFNTWLPINGVQITTLVAVFLYARFLFLIRKSVFYALKCFIPRGAKCEATVLFPYLEDSDTKNEIFQGKLEKLKNGADLKEK